MTDPIVPAQPGAGGSSPAPTPWQRLAGASGRLLAGTRAEWSELGPGRAYPSHVSIDAAAFRGVDPCGRQVFAKVYHADATRFFDLDVAVAAADLAGRSGLAPLLFGYDEASRIALFDFLDEPWRVATAADLRDPDTLAAIIEQRRRWAAEGLAQAPVEDGFTRADRLASLASDTLPERQLSGFEFLALRSTVEQIGQAFHAGGTDTAAILGDCSVSNVMLDDAGGVQLVDFDFACRGDPLRDVAGLCLEACSYDGDGVQAVLEMHFGSGSSALLARVRLLMVVEDFIWGTWALCMHASDPRRNTCEFFSYAGSRLLRANHALSRLDLPSLIQAI